MDEPTAASDAAASFPDAEEVRIDQGISSSNNVYDGSKKRRRFLLLAVVVGVVVIAIIAAVVAGGNDGSGQSSSATAARIKNHKRFNAIQAYVGYLSDKNALQDATSPQYHAVQWLTDQDDLQIDIPSTTEYKDAFPFWQRYILAVFYYTLNGPSWSSQANFLSADSVCDWNHRLQANVSISGSSQTEYVMGVRCNTDDEVNYIFLRKL